MKAKVVQFGNLETTQIECPSCKIWQFESDRCDCGFYLKNQIRDFCVKPEIRIEEPSWRRSISKRIKQDIYERDEYICQYCGRWCYESYVSDPDAVVVDHIIPVSYGGSNKEYNLITSCRECNSLKSNMIFGSFEEARKYILSIRNG